MRNKYNELATLYNKQQNLLNNIQQDLDFMKQQRSIENDDNSYKVLNKTMTEVLRMKSVISNKDTDSNVNKIDLL